jgi:flagellar basal body-associated protein FliL
MRPAFKPVGGGPAVADGAAPAASFPPPSRSVRPPEKVPDAVRSAGGPASPAASGDRAASLSAFFDDTAPQAPLPSFKPRRHSHAAPGPVDQPVPDAGTSRGRAGSHKAGAEPGGAPAENPARGTSAADPGAASPATPAEGNAQSDKGSASASDGPAWPTFGAASHGAASPDPATETSEPVDAGAGAAAEAAGTVPPAYATAVLPPVESAAQNGPEAAAGPVSAEAGLRPAFRPVGGAAAGTVAGSGPAGPAGRGAADAPTAEQAAVRQAGSSPWTPAPAEDEADLFPAGTGGTGGGTGGGEGNGDKPGMSGGKRALIVILVVVIVLLAGGITYYFASKRSGGSVAGPTTTVTATAGVATPTIQPSPKESGTDFFNALPVAVGPYVYQGSVRNTDWAAADGATEAYTVTYSDGTNTVTLIAGQWRTAALATAAQAKLVTASPDATAPGDTANATPGTASDANSPVTDQAGAATGPTAPTASATAMWVNDTAVFQAQTSTPQQAAEFKNQFPM